MTLRVVTAYRASTGLRLVLADAPTGASSLRIAGLTSLVSAARPVAGGVRLLLVAEGPAEALPGLRLLPETADGRCLPPLAFADPQSGPPPGAAFVGEAALGFALAFAAAERPALRPLLSPPPFGVLGGWLAALPALPGEALLAPDGSAGVWLPGAAAADLLALVPTAEGGLLPSRLHGPPPLVTGAGLLRIAFAPLRPLAPPPVGLVGAAAGRCGRLPARRSDAPAMAEAIGAIAARVASPAEASAFRSLALAERRERLASLAAGLAAVPEPGAPQVLLPAGLSDPFLRRLLVLAEPVLARRFVALLLAGPEAQEAGRWLRPRLSLPVGVARSLADAARQGGYARTALVPAGPQSLAAALAPAPERRPFPPALAGRALPALAALARAGGDEAAAVLHLAGEGAAPWAAP
ncbi:MAG: hypothetical protein NZM27_09945 [Acetobacteraceae bacterium]|nr:hypothetical protein [Acetobacteraceae bacterium]